ncbi:MAG: leucine-rich repeat domain-containing protein [Ruminococcus sp.]|nr:leucine-rich repeat domain-containing protein [Ruminococcus sp.]
MKKQIISGLLAACMAVSCLAVPTNNLMSGVISSDVVASADDDGEYTSGDYKYTVSNNKATITKYIGRETKLTIPSELGKYTVTGIGYGAFDCYSSLVKVTIPDTITNIGFAAFRDCENLKSITIPDSVTTIGKEAFVCCNNLKSVKIPASVTNIGACPFGSCRDLQKITVDSNNKYYSSLNGVLYNKAQTKLICCPGAKTSLTLPDTVTTIEEAAITVLREVNLRHLP